MKYLKVDVARQQSSCLLIEVPDDFTPKDMRKYNIQEMVDEELYDSLSWGDFEPVDVDGIVEVSEKEAKMYGITQLSNYKEM